MDPASAIIGIVSFGFTVIGQLNKIRKAIKDAPEQVQTLQDSSIVVGLLLSRIQVAGGCSLSRLPQTNAYFASLCKRAEDCLKIADQTLQKIIAQIPPDGNGNDKHKTRLNWRRWFMDKGALADLTGKHARQMDRPPGISLRRVSRRGTLGGSLLQKSSMDDSSTTPGAFPHAD